MSFPNYLQNLPLPTVDQTNLPLRQFSRQSHVLLRASGPSDYCGNPGCSLKLEVLVFGFVGILSVLLLAEGNLEVKLPTYGQLQQVVQTKRDAEEKRCQERHVSA